MKNADLLKHTFREYPSVKEETLQGRYIHLHHIAPLLKTRTKKIKVSEAGKSVLGKPVHRIDFGSGKIKILAWSQMHGNESTTTKAVFDFLNAVERLKNDPVIDVILQNCSFRIIPMLNPDGAEAYTRYNANNIDLNRDAQDLKEPESRILKKEFEDFNPDFCFNLHDQRTIFSAGEVAQPAVLSFLTPAMDENRQLFPERIKSMQVVAGIKEDLSEVLSDRIGRYDDAYNLNCTGDTFQTLKVPTILFEAGHYPKDYQREQVREYVFEALVSAFYSIATGNYKKMDYRKYAEIPENRKLFHDIIIRRAIITKKITDVAIQFKEELKDQRVTFLPVIVKIAPKINLFGHKEIDACEQKIKFTGVPEANENVIVNKIELNDEIMLLKDG